MQLIWFSWKDSHHPYAGGAEHVTHQILQRLHDDGVDVHLITSDYGGSKDGDLPYSVTRVGGRLTVYVKAFWAYRRRFAKTADLVIEEVNTIPFFTKFYTRGKHRHLLFYQLAREVWFYQMRFPLSWIGYIAEAVYVWLLRSEHVLTISNSTKVNLQRFGFDPDNIDIITVGINGTPLAPDHKPEKYEQPTILSHSSLRPMKRTMDHVLAFEKVKQSVPDAQLIVSGANNGPYGQAVLEVIENSPYRDDITVLGRTSDEHLTELYQKSHVIVGTSIKEGWGLTISEAGAQKTPAVVYDVDGFRDVVEHGVSGFVVEEKPHALSERIVELLHSDTYHHFAEAAWEKAKELTNQKSYETFKEAVEEV